MSEQEIQKQIELILALTKKATQSKESAIKILTDAGIIQEDKNTKAPLKK